MPGRTGVTRPNVQPDRSGASVTVALDLLGGDHAPAAVVDGALLALDGTPGLAVTLVGPPDIAAALLAERDARGRCSVAPASQAIAMGEDAVRAVRARSDATVRVAAGLVRDGQADATVSVGSTGAALAAALFTLGRLPGVTRPALALTLPSPRGPLVYLDAGALADAGPDLLAQFALAGSALASVVLGLADPRVGLLSIGEEPGKGDAVRKVAHRLLGELPIRFVGNVEGRDVALGGTADVVVTDGFTGNVLLKGIEGAVAAVTEQLPRELADDRLTARVAPALARVGSAFGADGVGGGVLLGVPGVSVVGHGSSSPRAVAACIGAAVRAVRDGLVPRVAEALAGLVARRRAAAGLPPQGVDVPSASPMAGTAGQPGGRP